MSGNEGMPPPPSYPDYDYQPLPLPLRHPPYPVDDTRGSFVMWLVIFSEACLYGALFGSYWYTGKYEPIWPPDPAPKLHYAIPSLFIMLVSAPVLYWGELQLRKQKPALAKLAMSLAVLAALGYFAFTIRGYIEHIQTLAPTADSYSSIFYAITTIHAVHVVLGFFMMLFVLLLGTVDKLEPREMPHKPYHSVALYWYFTVFTYLLLVIFLYIIPFVRR